jgi:hypothetical protein
MAMQVDHDAQRPASARATAYVDTDMIGAARACGSNLDEI